MNLDMAYQVLAGWKQRELGTVEVKGSLMAEEKDLAVEMAAGKVED